MNYSNPALDGLLDQANAALDRGRRLALFQQADQLVAKDVPLIPIMYTRFVYLVSPRVKGLEFVPLSLGLGPFRTVDVSR